MLAVSHAEKKGLFGTFFDAWRPAWIVYIEACVIGLVHEALIFCAR